MSAIRSSVRVLALTALFATPAAFAADAAAGKAVFEKYACVACHTTAADGPAMPGPSLAGVVGRKAGSVKDFAMYSAALKEYGATWNAKTLDEFLANPMGKVPGTSMLIPVSDAKERADLIGYLATLKGK